MKQITFTPIEEKTLNDKLVNLYGSHLVGLYTEVEKIYNDDQCTIKPALPLLLELIDDDRGGYPYEYADLRIMIFGRDTNNWNDNSGNGTRKDAKIYTEYGTYNFHLQTNEDILAEIRGKHIGGEDEINGICDIYCGYHYYGSPETVTPFTQKKNQFVEQLKSKLNGKRVEELWNNVNKIGCGAPGVGKSTDKVPSYIKEVEERCFNVIRQEIEILKPDVVIFMTKEEDNKIKKVFGITDEAFTTIDNNLPNLSRLAIPGVKYAARTIHPGFKSNDELSAYNNALIEDILKHV